MADGISFTPSNAQAPAAPAAPAADGISFSPSGGAPSVPQETQPSGSGLGSFALSLGKGAAGVLMNNPISRGVTSLAAMPAQGFAKLIGAPDPFAHGAAGVNITSSDQSLGKYAEQQAGNALTVGSLFLNPAAGAAKIAPSLAPFIGAAAGPVSRIGTTAALGALQGLGGGMQEGQTGAQLKKSIGTGALIGGGLAAAGELGSALLSSLASKTPEGRLGEQVNRLKTLQNSFDDNSTFMRDPATGKMVEQTNPIKTLSSSGLVTKLKVIDGRVNTEGVESGLSDMLAHADKQAKSLVAGLKGTVPLDEFKASVENAVQGNPALRGSGGVSKALGQIGRMFEDYQGTYGDDLTYPQINEIRTSMNRYFNADTVDIERTVGNAARDALYSAEGGSPELKGVMGGIGQLLKAQNFVDRLRGTVVRGGRLGKYLADMVGSGVGTAIGSGLGPFGMGAGAFAGGAITDRAMSMYQNNFFNPALAGAARSLGSLAPTLGAVARVGQAGVIPGAVKQ